MATYQQRIRQGLPRTPGGPAWPDVEGAVVASAAPPAAPVEPASPVEVVETPAPPVEPASPVEPVETPAPTAGAVTEEVALRRGLPRTPGGEPWPPAGTASVVRNAGGAVPEASAAVPAAALVAPAAAAPAAAPAAASEVAPAAAAATSVAAVAPAAAAAFDTVSEEVTLRRGLPRTPGGEPWPPAGNVTVQRAVASLPAAAAAPASAAPAAPAQAAAAETAAPAAASAREAATANVAAPAAAATTAAATTAAASTGAAAAPAAAAASSSSVAAKPAATKPAAAKAEKPKREPIMIRDKALSQWVKLALLWGGGLVVVAGILVLAARGLTTFPIVQEFREKYHGEYELPSFVEPGFPVWARWTHFLNFFFMALIIRTGLLVRTQQKPDAFYTPKKGGKKISIYLWLHTSVDLLWLANGIIFVVLLFVTGHWARIVPTSWEVFPNAAAAMLNYATLEWPHEDGWYNFNALQQLMYFIVVFIAAPLAAITGVRMSEWWPKDNEKLNKFYPAPLARKIHFPVMLFFVVFVAIHVFLVFATGPLKNLNHMFVGSSDPSWWGFLWFAVGLIFTVAAVWAARPLVLAPIAGAFGKVSER